MVEILKIGDPQELRGKLLVFYGAMHGGKTLNMICLLGQLEHAGICNIAVFNKTQNTRDGIDQITAGGRFSYPAKSCQHIFEIKKSLSFLEEELKDAGINREGDIHFGGLALKRKDHREKNRIEVVAIDEANLFCLGKEEHAEMEKLINSYLQEGSIVILSGLTRDFRDELFGNFSSFLNQAYFSHEFKPFCKAVGNGDNPCGKEASYSQKLWLFEREENKTLDEQTARLLEKHFQRIGLLKEELSRLSYFDFYDKKNCLVSKKYIAAPYFSPTVEIELPPSVEIKPFVYVPVCEKHFQLPFREETLAVLREIKYNEPKPEIKGSKKLREMIEEFLGTEKRI